MLGWAQHFTRVIFALGSAASEREAGNSAAPAPAARNLRSDLRLTIGPAFRVKVGATSYHSGSRFTMRASAAHLRGAFWTYEGAQYANDVDPRLPVLGGHSGDRSRNTQHNLRNGEG